MGVIGRSVVATTGSLLVALRVRLDLSGGQFQQPS
jgi:hypothetical protein